MSAYTEQYEIAVRTARRELRDAKAKRKRWMRLFVGLAVPIVPLLLASVGLFYVEHLQPYTAEEAQKIAGGGTVGPSFFGGVAITALLLAIAFGVAFGWTLESNLYQMPKRTRLQELADAVEDAQADLDDAVRHEEEEQVRRYTADTRTHSN
jgi:hypothetical protein